MGQVDQHLFRADLKKIGLFQIPMLQDIGGLPAAGFCQMPLDQSFQLIFQWLMVTGHVTRLSIFIRVSAAPSGS